MIYGFTVYYWALSQRFPSQPHRQKPPWTWFLQEESKDVDDALGVLGMNGLRESGRNRPGYIWFIGSLSWVSKPETFVTQASWPLFQPCCPYLIWILLILLTHPHVLERKALKMWGKAFVSGSIGAKFGYYITEIGLNLKVMQLTSNYLPDNGEPSATLNTKKQKKIIDSRVLFVPGCVVIAVSLVSRMVLLDCDVWWTQQSRIIHPWHWTSWLMIERSQSISLLDVLYRTDFSCVF